MFGVIWKIFLSEHFNTNFMKIWPLGVEISLIEVCKSSYFPKILGSHKNSLGDTQVWNFTDLIYMSKLTSMQKSSKSERVMSEPCVYLT